ncbi:hypothetical protein [Bacillus paranthracis]|uniref:hypothetical protein n=1 Tax=Bacillus paranthracis TaxID=2026186 RepID=UPI002FDC19D5|nr:hypothetical protein [Bacillus paranthracis]
MNKYVVIFYNRFVNEIQTYKATADNESDAKEKFYERYPSSAYGDDCIETIETIETLNDDKKLELNNDELKRIAEKWYLTLGMGMGTGKSELDTILFNKIRYHLDKQEN